MVSFEEMKKQEKEGRKFFRYFITGNASRHDSILESDAITLLCRISEGNVRKGDLSEGERDLVREALLKKGLVEYCDGQYSITDLVMNADYVGIRKEGKAFQDALHDGYYGSGVIPHDEMVKFFKKVGP